MTERRATFATIEGVRELGLGRNIQSRDGNPRLRVCDCKSITVRTALWKRSRARARLTSSVSYNFSSSIEGDFSSEDIDAGVVETPHEDGAAHRTSASPVEYRRINDGIEQTLE